MSLTLVDCWLMIRYNETRERGIEMIRIDYDALDTFLEQRGMSRRQLAAKIGIAPNTLAGSFRRQSKMKIDQIWKIADALAISPVQLLPESNYDNPSDYNRDLELITSGRSGHRNMLSRDKIIAILDDLFLLNVPGLEAAHQQIHLLTEVPRFQKTSSELTEEYHREEEKLLDEYLRDKHGYTEDSLPEYESYLNDAADHETPF